MRRRENTTLNSWQKFLLLEHRLMTALEWIQPDDQNFSCYSKGLATLLRECHPQLESAALSFSPDTTGFTPRADQAVFHAAICHYHPRIHELTVSLAGYDMVVRPWGVWRSSDMLPDWWLAAGEIASGANVRLERATLRSAINAVAGLFILLLLGAARDVPELSPGNRLLAAGPFVDREGAEEVLRAARVRDSQRK